MNMHKIIFITILLVSLFLSSGQTYAQKSPIEILQVEPSILHISLSPGKTYHYDISVTNLLNQALPVTVTVENFDEADEEGGFQFSQVENPLTSWTTLSQKDMILEPNQKRTIPVDIRIPSTVPVGGYSTIIFLNPILPQNANNPTKINAKVGILAVANVGVPDSPRDKLEIIDFSFDQLFSTTPSPAFVLRVKNNSLYHRVVRPTIIVKNVIGQKESFQFEDRFIFPGKVRRWEKVLNTKNMFGIFQATAHVSVGEGIQIEKSQYIIILPSTKVFLFVPFIIIALALLLLRKRVSKAFKALSEKD
jgi:hypothetical protein